MAVVVEFVSCYCPCGRKLCEATPGSMVRLTCPKCRSKQVTVEVTVSG